jgi:hypothetical protein
MIAHHGPVRHRRTSDVNALPDLPHDGNLAAERRPRAAEQQGGRAAGWCGFGNDGPQLTAGLWQ